MGPLVEQEAGVSEVGEAVKEAWEEAPWAWGAGQP